MSRNRFELPFVTVIVILGISLIYSIVRNIHLQQKHMKEIEVITNSIDEYGTRNMRLREQNARLKTGLKLYKNSLKNMRKRCKK